MTRPAPEAQLLANRTLTVRCERPDLVLKHGEDTPLSRAAAELAQTLREEVGARLPDDARLAVVGASRSGELRTLDLLARRFQAAGAGSVDPVLFAKANQFYPVFAACKRLAAHGPASSLLTCESLSAEILYFAYLLLRQGRASHVLALAYDHAAAPSEQDEAAVTQVEACGLVLGPVDGRRPTPVLTSCSLGPYLASAADGERVHAELAAADEGTSTRLLRPADPSGTSLPLLCQAIECLDSVACPQDRATLHVVPRAAGNVVSVRCRLP